MTNEEAINELLQCYSLYSPFKTVKKTNEAISMAIAALGQAPTFGWLMQKADEWGMAYGKQFLIEAQRVWKDGKDTNVPTNSALDHIHSVVRDDAYRRGYEHGKADAVPRWIPIAESEPEEGREILATEEPNGGWYIEVIIRTYHAKLHRKEVIAWMPLPEPWKGEGE